MVFKKLEDIEVWRRGCRLAVEIYKLNSIVIGVCAIKSAGHPLPFHRISLKDMVEFPMPSLIGS